MTSISSSSSRLAIKNAGGILLDTTALQSYLPHRGVNLIPDALTIAPDKQSAVSRTQIVAHDPRGREIFARQDAHGQACWYEPFLMELLALTGVPVLRDQLTAAGHEGVFSMVSRVAYSGGLVPIHDEVMGYGKIHRSRNGFTTFHTWAEHNGLRILEAEVISGSAAMVDIMSAQVRPPTDLSGEPITGDRLAWKPAHLRFAERIVKADPVAHQMTVAYTYPTDHPFVPGHFPNAALMMGMTQWSAIADAAWIAAERFGITGNILTSGRIVRPDGSEVMDVRELLLIDEGGVPRIASTKRIAFREPVRPGDGLMVEVTVAPAPAPAPASTPHGT